MENSFKLVDFDWKEDAPSGSFLYESGVVRYPP
jgi:hypothetical protein